PDSTQVYCAHEYTLANLKFALVAEPDNEDLKQRMADTTAMRRQNQNTVPSALGLEKRTNPFLRSQIPELKQAAEQFAGKPLPTGADVFGTVRYWKDTLD
ncbi:MAG: hydroxyacylglutathione hydrolase, partial [Gammaproteobacteria bacterium]|nr:hydroxyacylglutathione hydrolase [Gammaproteobacteria bacterium]